MALPQLSSNSPSVGYISWTQFGVQFAGTGYSVPAGNTNKRFVWWEYRNGAPALAAGDAVPDLAAEDILLFLNKGGIGALAPVTDVMDGSLLVSGSVLADAIGANQINTTHLVADSVTADILASNAVQTEHLSAGSITVDKLSAASVSENLLANGSFEEFANGLPLGWQQIAASNGSIAVVTGVSSSGAYAARLAATTTTANVRMRQAPAQFIPVTSVGGRRWYIGARVGAGTATTQGFYLRANWFDANKVQLSTGGTSDARSNVGIGTSWAMQEGTVIPPAAARYLGVEVLLVSPNVATNLYVDEVIAHEIIVAAQIGDGQITTPKLVANAVTAEKADLGSFTANTGFISDLSAKIIVANAFQGKTFTGGTFTGALIQTDTDPELGVKLGAAGIQAFDSRVAFTNPDTLEITPNPNYKARTFFVDPSSGNVDITGTLTATSKVQTTDGATTTDKGDVTVTVGPDAIRGGPMGSFTILGMPGMRWSNISSTMLAAAGIGADGEGNLLLTSGGASNDERKSLRLTPWGAEMYGSLDIMEGQPLVMNDGHLYMGGSGNINVDGGKLVFTRDHTGGAGYNWIQSDHAIKFSQVNSTALANIYAANIYSTGNTHLLTDSGFARLVGRNPGANNWVSLLRDDTGGELFGLRRTGSNTSSAIQAVPIYDLTISASANVYVSTAGWMYRATSASKYKLMIQPVDPNTYEDALLGLVPKSWFDKHQSEAVADYQERIANGEPVVDPETGEPLTMAPFKLERQYGYVAEDLDVPGLRWALQRDDNTGELEGIQYDRIAAALIPIVSKYRTRLRNLETNANQRVSSLESRVTTLENRLKAAGIP